MNDEMRLIKHALGWPSRHRNHYVTTMGTPEWYTWRKLVARGLAQRFDMPDGGHLQRAYRVTPKGIDKFNRAMDAARMAVTDKLDEALKRGPVDTGELADAVVELVIEYAR